MLTDFKVLSLLDFTIYLQQDPILHFPPHLKHVTTLRNFCCGHIRLSVSYWWCSWTCQSLRKRT